MTSWLIVGCFIAGGGALFLFALLTWKSVRGYRPVPQGEGNGYGGFSPARYRPMIRLLAEDDFTFLASQPGYRPEIGTKLLRERRRIFRMYLNELGRDFHRLHAEARALLADSPEQHPELVGLLLRQQLIFWRAMAGIELRLAPRAAGLGHMHARGLVEAIEQMRLDLDRVARPAPVAV